jgi:HEAT repeat protein
MNFLHKFPIMKLGLIILAVVTATAPVWAQASHLTPMQERVQAQQRHLSSTNVEERRDALMTLAAMNHPDAARAALSALNDPEPVVRVTAAHALRALPAADATMALLPLLKDKLEFVRREVAHALGDTHSSSAVQPLVELLNNDQESSVRAAAALALGNIHDEAAVVPLVNALTGNGSNKKSKAGADPFVKRAAAESLGMIRSRAGVAALIATLSDEQSPIELRRVAAQSLGAIGDPSASQALQTATGSADPYLSETARAALHRLH